MAEGVRVGAGMPGPCWMEFPFFPGPARALLEEVATRIERELRELLLDSKTPEDVAFFQSPSGNAQGSVLLRTSLDKAQVSLVVGSWLHCELAAGTLDMATLSVMLGPETDAPHLLLELIVSGSSSVVLLLDLLPRKDVVMEPHYLDRFYADTELEKVRQDMDKHPAAHPYVSASLFSRSVVSATALLFKFPGLQPEPASPSIQTVFREVVQPAVRRVFHVWLQAYRYRGKEVRDEQERLALATRDAHIKTKVLEADFSSNLPRLFGQRITNRVLAAYSKGE